MYCIVGYSGHEQSCEQHIPSLFRPKGKVDRRISINLKLIDQSSPTGSQAKLEHLSFPTQLQEIDMEDPRYIEQHWGINMKG